MAVYQNLTLTQLSQDVDANSSKVRILWQSTQTGPSYNAIPDVGRYTVSVNGQELFTREVTFWLPQNTTQTIVDVEETVFHNAKGEAQITVKTWMNTHISAGIVELSKTVQLDTIPQSSTVSASNGVIGGSARLAVTKRNAECTHAIGWRFGSLSGYLTAEGQISEEAVRFAAESLDFPLPESFYSQIPDEKSGICTLTVYTYSGEKPVGTPQTAQFTVSVQESECIPAVWGNVVDVNPATVALTGDERFLVRYHSTAHCAMVAEAKNGAWIAQKKIQGKTVEGDSLTVPNVETGDFYFEATDSRGITGTALFQTVCVPYSQLSCIASVQRDGPASGEATLSVSGDFYNGSFGVADNQLSLSYSIDGGNFIPVEAEVDGNGYSAQVKLTGMDYTRLYYVTVRAADCLTQLEKKTVLKKGVPSFDWGEQDFAFHVPVQMDGSLNVDGGVTLGGKTLLDIFYPVGTVYMTTAGKDPAELFGGTWELLQSDNESIFQWRRRS